MQPKHLRTPTSCIATDKYKLLISMDDELKEALHRITSETESTLSEFVRDSIRYNICEHLKNTRANF